MSTSIHPNTSRNAGRATILVMLVGALVLLSGCVGVPTGKTPGLATAKVEATRVSPELTTTGGTAAAISPAAPRGVGTAAAESSAPTASTPNAPEPITPGTSGATNPSTVTPSLACELSDSPEVFAMGVPKVAAVRLPQICITGFAPGGEVELWVTDPDGESQYYTEIMNADGTGIVNWSAETDLLTGTYTFEATQDDLRAINSVDVEPGAETQETITETEESVTEPEEGEPAIEVSPVGDSGWDFEVALSGFEPNQEVLLALYVATDETMTEFEQIDSISEQVDDQGNATFPLEITPDEYPSPWFALAGLREDGSQAYTEFQVE